MNSRPVATALALASGAALALYLAHPAAALMPGPWWLLLPGALLYLASHLLRALRIFLLLYDGRVRALPTLGTHLHAAGVSALVPWKLGELYRIVMFDRLAQKPVRCLMAVWVERIWDGAALLVLLPLVAATTGAWPAGLPGLLAVAAGFLFASGFLFLVLPENLNLAKRYLIVRQRGERALWLLAWVDGLHGLLTTAATLLRYRILTMGWITIGIWSLEGAALLAVLQAVDAGSGAAAGVLVDRLTGFGPWSAPAAGSAEAAYRAATLDTLVVLALALLAWAVIAGLARWLRENLPGRTAVEA